MELTSASRGGGGGARVLAPPSRLTAYVATIGSLGLIGVAWVLVSTDWVSTFDEILLWPCVFLAVAAIAGEVKPLVVSSRAQERTLSTSAPFVLALVAVAGVGIAVLVQVIASAADDVHRRREFKKSLFNTAQYALSVISARAVYAWLTDTSFFGVPSPSDTHEVGPLLVAGVAMIGVNWMLVAFVVSLATDQPVWHVLRGDVRDLLVTNVVLLSVGGIAAVVAADGVATLALLAAPVVAAHLFAAAAARHAYDATHDLLTGLGNRGHLQFELERSLREAAHMGSSGPGLVLVDLDHFKDINDTLGHPVGDDVLRKVAEALCASAPAGATVHRLGGDEFAIVVPGDRAAADAAARGVLDALDGPVVIGDLELLVRASCGVAVAPAHGNDPATLMKNSDIALYHAKLERDRVSVFSPEFDVNTVERLQLLADLRAALEQGNLYVAYQPQIDLASGRIVGVEALVRWRHPERGLVPADQFVSLAESSGLIVLLTAHVLDSSLAQVALWRADGHDIRVAVNLSARLLSDLALPEQVDDALRRHGLPPDALVLEVTETGIMADAVRADVVVKSLRSLGVAIAIDDYGTGNASLSYLRRLEIDELKVDRSFVSNIGTVDHDRIIVQSTISLARALGLRVVAEGIEDEPTAVALRDLGCDVGQGYHLGRPESADHVTALLEGARTVPRRRAGEGA